MSSLLLCVLVTIAASGAQAVSLGQVTPGSAAPQHPGADPEPCQIPRYFTFKQVDLIVSVEEGKLKAEEESWTGAWDFISQEGSFQKEINYENGTIDYDKVIDLYDEGVRYIIQKRGEETVCHKEETEGTLPDQFTFPKDAKFVGQSTFGDRELLVNNWYALSEQGTKHTVRSFSTEGCVPIGLRSRKYDPETGDEVEVRDSSLFDLVLGICDREKYFKVPDVCKPGRALMQPTASMLKWRKFLE